VKTNADPPAIGSRGRQQAQIDRALAKAHEQSRAGNAPALPRAESTGTAIAETWSVASRTTGGEA
jgi:hypothetical protein